MHPKTHNPTDDPTQQSVLIVFHKTDYKQWDPIKVISPNNDQMYLLNKKKKKK